MHEYGHGWKHLGEDRRTKLAENAPAGRIVQPLPGRSFALTRPLCAARARRPDRLRSRKGPPTCGTEQRIYGGWMRDLEANELRVLGVLIEKEMSTPEQYPLTLNSLTTGCNQKTSRNPVTEYDERSVYGTIQSLSVLGLVEERSPAGSRVARYAHRAGIRLDVRQRELAVLAVLMLRGPLTLAEIRTCSARLFAFEDLEDVLRTVDKLAHRDPPYCREMERQPGQKERRFVQCLAPETRVDSSGGAGGGESEGLRDVVEMLRAEVAELRQRLDRIESRQRED